MHAQRPRNKNTTNGGKKSSKKENEENAQGGERLKGESGRELARDYRRIETRDRGT